MAITCPCCGAEFDATLFQFGHRVRCHCGAEVEYPGTDLRAGHVIAPGEDTAISHEDRCVGCLLGTACGDILGAAVEGSSARDIRELYGEIRDFTEVGRGFGCYTDDTQMTLALATSLVECGHVGFPAVREDARGVHHPGRGLRRRHGYYRRYGWCPGGRVARQFMDSGPLARQHRKWRSWAG